MGLSWKVSGLIGLPLAATAVSKVRESLVDRWAVCAEDSLRCAPWMKVSSTLDNLKTNCIETKLKIHELVPCSDNFHLCGSKGNEPTDCCGYQPDSGDVNADFEPKSITEEDKLNEWDKSILERHFGREYKLFETPVFPTWEATIEEYFMKEKLVPNKKDSLVVQLHEVRQEIKFIRFILRSFGSHLPTGYLNELKMKLEELQRHEKELVRLLRYRKYLICK